VSCSVLENTEGVVAPRQSSNRENHVMPALRHPLVTPSLPNLFLQGNHMPQLQKTLQTYFSKETICHSCRKPSKPISPRKPYAIAAENHVLETPLIPIIRRILPSKHPKNALMAIWLQDMLPSWQLSIMNNE